MRFKDVLGCSSLDRQIEVITGRPMKGVPALLKTKRIYLQVDEARELSKKTPRRGLDGHGIPLVGRVVSPSW
ncbi:MULTISPECIES: DUF1651 domain-containing protein [Prochlorococcus]|uniref:DUF1651 domain-containing protein n=1 Tax=Prochlorococcus TaxID=1218 RepID=UPI001F30FBAE|nr:DUF1651 domain-containing protein [Prochlorococcus marinus]